MIKTQTLPSSLSQALDKPTLHALSYALRHPDTWPEGFVWYFGDCDQCAMGLAHALWSSIPQVGIDDGQSVMARKFSMPYEQADRIFYGDAYTKKRMLGLFNTRIDHERITPEMVADKIDAYLAIAE